MEFSGKTDIGRKRSTNQDNLHAAYMELPEDEKILLAAVCDGMGGAAGGNVASRLAISVFVSYVEKKVKEEIGKEITPFERILTEGVDIANTALVEEAAADSSLSGMGTTLVACLVTREHIYAINVGDSRMYVYRDHDTTIQLTRDHSYVQSLVDSGQISSEQAKNHPNKNIITRALGIEPVVESDTFKIDRGVKAILLCSDGLSGYLPEPEIAEIVLGDSSVDEITDLLIKRANENGGGDNITAIVIKSE